MATFNKLVEASTLEEAYELNLKQNNVVLGGFMWLKQSKRHFQTAIDLSGLNLNQIDETDEVFSIGSMCTLRQLELHEGLNREFQGGIRQALGHIVGVQFRNGATVGGSVYGRFGFSDVLTCLLTLETYVELYQSGIIPLKDFIQSDKKNDILMGILIKRDQRRLAYYSQRLSHADFPIIAVGVSRRENTCRIAVGARPMGAALLDNVAMTMTPKTEREEVTALGEWASNQFGYGSNQRGSADYRKQLAAVYIKRGLMDLLEESGED